MRSEISALKQNTYNHRSLTSQPRGHGQAFQAHAVHQEVAKVVQTKDCGIPVNIAINVDHPSILGSTALVYSSRKMGTGCSQGTRSNQGS